MKIQVVKSLIVRRGRGTQENVGTLDTSNYANIMSTGGTEHVAMVMEI